MVGATQGAPETMNAADIGPVAPEQRTQSAFDLFLIFVGANIVATTIQVGASLSLAFSLREVMTLIATGAVAGAALVATLAPLGPRLGVPSVIAARAALGRRGASLVAVLLYVTNFAWIAVNNVIAASACARAVGGDERVWALALGLLATAVVAGGPRAVGLADRLGVPLLALAGILLSLACLDLPREVLVAPPARTMSWSRGLDVVIGYQVSWILMFADYSRYTRSEARSAVAVFLGLALTSLWFMPLGALSARAAASTDPGAMLQSVGLGGWGAALLAVATVTTNFVNIYLSSLAWKSLVPGSGDQKSVWSIGLIGAALSLLSTTWLDRYADFMVVLGTVLVPVGGVLLTHFFLLPAIGRGRRQWRAEHVAALYDPHGPHARGVALHLPAVVAWIAGALTYHLAASIGGTLPALAATVLTYGVLFRPDRPA
jgi:purine-cytosine permease-like protein